MLEVANCTDTLVIPTLLSLRQENHEFWVVLNKEASASLAWAILRKGKGSREEKGPEEMPH